MKFRVNHFLLGYALLALGGCQTVYEGKYEWGAGWRPGTVREVGLADQITKEAFRDCRKGLTASDRSTQKFAVVTYPYLSRSRNSMVPIFPESNWNRGDLIYINILNCSSALARRSIKAGRNN